MLGKCWVRVRRCVRVRARIRIKVKVRLGLELGLTNFLDDVPGDERVNSVLKWLDLPPSKRPSLILMYCMLY